MQFYKILVHFHQKLSAFYRLYIHGALLVYFAAIYVYPSRIIITIVKPRIILLLLPNGISTIHHNGVSTIPVLARWLMPPACQCSGNVWIMPFIICFHFWLAMNWSSGWTL